MAIPTNFLSTGVLAPGTYEATIPDLRKSILVQGDGSSSTWDMAWRDALVSSVEILAKELWRVGFSEVFIDGSFVEDKDHPNDIDGYFDTGVAAITPASMTALQLQISALNSLNQYKVWDWNPRNRVFDASTGKKQLPMWVRYRVEFYPHIAGTHAGIKDQFGNDLQFPAAFRQSRRNFLQKGIVKLIP